MIITLMMVCMVFVSCKYINPLEYITTIPETSNTTDEFSAVEGFTLSREFFDKEFTGTVISKSQDTIGYGDYIYLRQEGFVPYNRKNINTMVKYNIDTGEKSAVCPDPLCNHNNEDCFFSRCFYIHDIKDDIIYYTGNYKGSEMKGLNEFDENGNYVGVTKEDYYASYIKPFYAFNIKTGERKIIFEFHSRYGYNSGMSGDPVITMTDDKIFFKEYSIEYEVVDGEELVYHVMSLCSFDRKTNKTEKLIKYSRYTAGENGSIHYTYHCNPYYYDENSNKVFCIKSYSTDDGCIVDPTYAISLDDKNSEFEDIYPNGIVICITEDGRYILTKYVQRDISIEDEYAT